jgi:hypothetical protein
VGVDVGLTTSLATSKHKDDPLKSEYGSSVIAAYRSAHQIISFVHYLYSQVQHPVDRVWFLWANVFGAAVSATLRVKLIIVVI